MPETVETVSVQAQAPKNYPETVFGFKSLSQLQTLIRPQIPGLIKRRWFNIACAVSIELFACCLTL